MKMVLNKYMKLKHNTKTFLDLALILLIMLFAKMYYSKFAIVESSLSQNNISYIIDTNSSIYSSKDNLILNVSLINKENEIRRIGIKNPEINIYLEDKIIYNRKEQSVDNLLLLKKKPVYLSYTVNIENLDVYSGKKLTLEYKFHLGQLKKEFNIK